MCHRHLQDHEKKALSYAMFQDIYLGLKPTLDELSEKHCNYCSASAVGNAALNAALWIMCMPYSVGISRHLGGGDQALKDTHKELYEKASKAAEKRLSEFFTNVYEKMREM